MLLLLVSTAGSRAAQLGLFVAFGAGTLVGMLLVTLSLAAVVRAASQRGTRWATALHIGAATASVMVGLSLAWSVVASR